MVQMWSDTSYTPRDRILLRQNILNPIAIPLSLDTSALRYWVDGFEPEEPVWRALLSIGTDSARARAYLVESMGHEAPGLQEPYEPFVLGRAASLLGDHALATAMFSRLDSIPMRLDVMYTGWGSRVLSYLLRAEEYEAMGEDSVAVEFRQRFVDAWSRGDSLTVGLVRSGRARSPR